MYTGIYVTQISLIVSSIIGRILSGSLVCVVVVCVFVCEFENECGYVSSDAVRMCVKVSVMSGVCGWLCLLFYFKDSAVCVCYFCLCAYVLMSV
jgi:hypothetical protein